MKKSVYLDSTIPNYLFEEREELIFQHKLTQKWFKEEADKFELFISNATVNELKRSKYPHQQQALECAAKINILDMNDDIDLIVDTYIKNYLMPKDLEGDAVHLAYASFHKIDFLLTWNCNHLANANKQQHIRIINGRLGISTPQITTPLELFTEPDNGRVS